MKPTIINSRDLTTLKGVADFARQTNNLLSTNAANGAKGRPTVAKLNIALDNLMLIASKIERVLDGMIVPALIENASEPERIIVGKLVADLLAAGFNITIDDGGGISESPLRRSTDAAAIFAALASTDSDTIFIATAAQSERHTYHGWVRLVWGNDCDVISDYTTNIEKHVAGANALAEVLEADNG